MIRKHEKLYSRNLGIADIRSSFLIWTLWGVSDSDFVETVRVSSA